MAELKRNQEDMERSSRVQIQAEHARQCVALFTQLSCTEPEIANEFKKHQVQAGQLLLQPLSDEAFVEAASVYATVIRLLREPDGLEPAAEEYRTITDTIGFVTKHALVNGWLTWSSAESSAAAREVIGEQTAHPPMPAASEAEAAESETEPAAAPEVVGSEPGSGSGTGIEAIAQFESRFDVLTDAAAQAEEFEAEANAAAQAEEFEAEANAAAQAEEFEAEANAAAQAEEFEAEANAAAGALADDEAEASERAMEAESGLQIQAEPSSAAAAAADVGIDAEQAGPGIDFGRLVHSVFDKAKAKDSFSANKFEGELRLMRGGTKAIAYAMGFIYNCGVLAVSQLTELVAGLLPSFASNRKEVEDLLKASLHKFSQKGYLAEHTLVLAEDTDTCYSLTDFGAGAFRKETSRKFLLAKSQLRLVSRPEEDDFLRLAPPDAGAAAYRLRELNRAHHRLSRKMPGQLMLMYTGVAPFPHRKLRRRVTGQSFVLVPGLPDTAQLQADLSRMLETIAQYDDAAPVVVADSIESGQYWADALSTPANRAYFLYVGDGELLLGDAAGEDCSPSLLGWESPEVSADAELELSLQEETAAEDHVEVELPALPHSEPGTSSVSEAPAQTSGSDAPAEHTTAMHPDDLERVVGTALTMLEQGQRAEGMVLLHAVSGHSAEVEVLSSKLAYILGDPLMPDEDWFSLADMPVSLPFGDSELLNDYLNAAMWLRIFFDPDNPNDYRLGSRWLQINSDRSSPVLEQYPAIKQLIGYYWSFIDRYHVGLKYCASNDVRDHLDFTRSLELCRQQITETLESVFPRNVKANINHPKIHQMVTELYGNSGILTQTLQRAFTMPLAELSVICQQFTGADLSAGEIDPELGPTDSKLEAFIDQHWSGMKFKSDADKSTTLTGAFRNRMRSRLHEATGPLLRCYVYRVQEERQQAASHMNPDTINKVRQQTQVYIREALGQLAGPPLHATGHQCLAYAIRRLQDALGDRQAKPPRKFYASLLLSGEIELDRNYLPLLDDDWQQETPIAGYRIWERALRHCSDRLESWEAAAEQALRQYDMGTFALIANGIDDFSLASVGVDDAKVDEIRKQAKQLPERYKNDFMNDIESAQNYGQMTSNDEMHGYQKLVEAARKRASETENVGFFKRLLEACRRQIVHGSDARLEATRSRLKALKDSILHDPARGTQESDEEVLSQWPILDRINLMLEKRNMTVAEDYIQLAGKGHRDTPSIEVSDKDTYMKFLEQYQSLYSACNSHKRDDLNRIYEQSVRNQLFRNQNNRNTASADRFIKSWYKPQSLGEFMSQLIFHKNKVNKHRDNEYYVYPEPSDAKLGQYPHPFEVFGTKAVECGVRILMMDGMRSADTVLDEVTQMGAGDGSATIVILNYALSLADRRQLAKSIKLRSIPEAIVVIDRVMALFLAGFSQIERGNAFLMVALPSSKVQPYRPNPDSGIPPEMFIGRTDELDKIQNPSGPVFVYGGRQLGKTALLKESKHREHDPENGRYAIFVDLKKQNVEESLHKICKELENEGLIQQPCGTWDELVGVLRVRLSSREQPVRKLMLLLDEADAFIASCEPLHYRPLELLKELKDTSNHQFKFVLAGLRDIVRFNKQRLRENSVLAHLGHITIRPLKYLDARNLLLRPLQYLGFRIDQNGEDIISLILAKTNYYPGLIHFYCEKLIEAIADSYGHGNYKDNETPPYKLDERHIKTLLGHSEFLSEIERKFSITLQLDADNLYDILAKAMAYHYHEKGIGKGASVDDIIHICQYFDIHKIGKMSYENVRALLEEMDELNIFRRETQDSDKYVFNRYSFFQMLGNVEQVFEHLALYSEQREG
ncbi:AAA family ATPase [Cohnella fermenti]|uniref:ATP-binding protein n=1 Tax=Cohnella fermenti TaxID=2565925 RepID=A0A4S4BEG4_9BACL|nr:AAA family ATPase [Cohnella fermenti]THF72515.1 ATP-binding protein [Cohnella fermenti]